MSEELLGKCNHPKYTRNLEQYFMGDPTIITLSTNDKSRAKELINNENNYLFGNVEYKAVVEFECGACSKVIAPAYRPGQIPRFTCDNCKTVF